MDSFKTPPASPLKKTEQSPAQPVMASPIFAQQTFYFHPGSAGKSKGLTPNKTNTIPLSQYRGPSHCFIKNETGNIISEHTKPDTLQDKFAKVTCLLKNLKNRADRDYYFKIRTGHVGRSHFSVAQEFINECIKELTECYYHAENKALFLANLNQAMDKDAFYNPFGLKRIYARNRFDLTLANDPNVYAAPFRDNDFPPLEIISMPSAKRARTDALFSPIALPFSPSDIDTSSSAPSLK